MTANETGRAAAPPKDSHDKAQQDLQRSVDAAVPDAEELPQGFAENPLSQQVRKAIDQRKPEPGDTPLRGSDRT
ncbi:MAG TPA: hypothetical protein VHL31_05960 [Geminicoccus sp.]|jgi:hypothetical protein|uniref:hypothetical protein n=1 Tax=Geminicoccus sp. TaxID=2024832 RepID=UPI002E2EEC00|nr:hypothetical protein [Geminicoccus sp.]HEX2525834.1 hypothetical protein [Geminicoccus sp.]